MCIFHWAFGNPENNLTLLWTWCWRPLFYTLLHDIKKTILLYTISFYEINFVDSAGGTWSLPGPSLSKGVVLPSWLCGTLQLWNSPCSPFEPLRWWMTLWAWFLWGRQSLNKRPSLLIALLQVSVSDSSTGCLAVSKEGQYLHSSFLTS